jgi:hypothetical protein
MPPATDQMSPLEPATSFNQKTCHPKSFQVQKGECTWEGCDQRTPSIEELKAHLVSHGKHAFSNFIPPSKCVWAGCQSNAVIKSSKQYLWHLKNIHTEPLLCPMPNCSYKKPFRNDGDLGRHINTVHSSQRKYECPYDSCNAETSNFARRDKWLKHIRETQHFQDAFCPFHHCQLEFGVDSKGFTSRQAISVHFSKYHAERRSDRYHCGLGSCGLNPHCDHWTKVQLAVHLKLIHGLRFVWSGMYNMGNDKVFQAKHVNPADMGTWRDCRFCSGGASQ